MAGLEDDVAELTGKWNRRHAEARGPGDPARVLRENAHLLPPCGEALDLACGRGASALLLAALGLRVTAWDISPVAVQGVAAEAARRSLGVRAEVRDVIARPPAPESFDVILVSHFLDRTLVPALIGALRPDGLLYYQTFVRNVLSPQGPSNPRFRLADNELLALFAALALRVYREEGRAGDLTRGARDLAMLVGQKP